MCRVHRLSDDLIADRFQVKKRFDWLQRTASFRSRYIEHHSAAGRTRLHTNVQIVAQRFLIHINGLLELFF